MLLCSHLLCRRGPTRARHEAVALEKLLAVMAGSGKEFSSAPGSFSFQTLSPQAGWVRGRVAEPPKMDSWDSGDTDIGAAAGLAAITAELVETAGKLRLAA